MDRGFGARMWRNLLGIVASGARMWRYVRGIVASGARMWRNLRDIVAHTNTQAHAHTQAHTNTQAHAHTHTHVHRPRATPDQSNCRQPLSISYQWQPSGHVGDPSDCTPCTHMRVGCNSMRACARKLREAALPVIVRKGSPQKSAFRSRHPRKNEMPKELFQDVLCEK